MKKLIYLFLLAGSQLALGQINVETVPVENAGNTPDASTGLGTVNYTYSIGKYEVTIKQYTDFLNSVAATNTNSWIVNLWNPEMQSNPNIAGIARTGNGTATNPYIYTAIGDDTRPIACVSWFDAARFCNWMHNGGKVDSDTETGAYNLNKATSGVIAKNNNAKWYIPTENEWYKAAYNKRNSGYWRFATQSDTRPGNIMGNYYNNVNYRYFSGGRTYYSVNGSSAWAPVSYITSGGAFGNPSSWGTFDQSGNLHEWVDTPDGPVVRGGSWFDYDESSISSSARYWENSSSENIYTGFRIAKTTAIEPPIGILTLEVSNGISSDWVQVSVTSNMLTPDGKINIANLNGGSKFYRLKIEAK